METITVAELIKLLQSMPQDAKVYYEKDSWSLDTIRTVKIESTGNSDSVVVIS
jgi:hypothetical protein